MNPAVLNGIAEIIVPTISLLCFTGFGLLCFPSIRASFAERMRNRALRHSDAADVVAQLAALRGEVYALRAELAQTNRALPSGQASQDARNLIEPR